MPGPRHALQDTLAAHADGLRRLVRGLVYSDAEAEDVVQDTMLAAVQQERAPSSWAAWLTRVARNRASNLRRAEGRRARRERAAARPEAQPGAGVVVARLDEKQRVLECLRRVDEPYRETLILRYFDDLPPRTIALRRGVPVSTVKTHLQRGLVRLRAQLDDAHGGRRERWTAALLPLAGMPGDRSLLATALGWTAMKKITVALVSAALLVAAGWGAKELLWSEDGSTDGHEAQADVHGAGATASADADNPRLAGRDEPATGPPPPSPDPAPATKENSIHGRVVGLDGRPIRGAIVTARSSTRADPAAPLDLSTMRAETDVDGSYLAGPLLEGKVTVTARADGLASVKRTVPARGARVDLVMEPAFEIALIVIDPRGRRVEGARVVYTARAENLTEGKHEVAGTTDAKGTVRIDGVLDEPGGLRVSAEGYGVTRSVVRPAMFARPGVQTWTTIKLPERTKVEGLVVDKQTGEPIAGAVVTVGWGKPRQRLRTDAKGRFETRVFIGGGPKPPVRAQALGYRAARTNVENPADGVARVRIELEPAAPLCGIVRTAEGAPVEDAAVAVTAGRLFHDLEARSDTAGRFALAMPEYTGPRVSGPMPEEMRARLLARHRIPVAAHHPEHGYGIAGVPLSDLDEEIEIQLSGTGEVKGTVRTAAGAPAVGAIVKLVPQWKESRRVESEGDRLQSHLWARGVRPSAVANARGTFRLRGVLAATYRVEARLGDDRVAVEAGVHVEHGATREIALTLGEELTVRGRIQDQFGRPVPGVVIFPLRGEIDMMPATHSRSDGSFVIRGLTAGTYMLLLEGKNMHLPEQPQVTAGAQDVFIRVERSVPFMVIVTHAGRPYTKRFFVEVLDRDPPKRPTEGMVKRGPPYRLKMETWGPKGECTVSGLPPGDYRVRIRTRDGLQSEEDALISLTAGVEPSTLRFDILKP